MADRRLISTSWRRDGMTIVIPLDQDIVVTAKTTVLILGGWSPGPLNYIKKSLHSQCIFVEPKIPIPPVGCLWLYDPWTAALLGLKIYLIRVSLGFALHRGNESLSSRMFYLLICFMAKYMCIAGIVRRSMQRCVKTAMDTIQSDPNLEIIVGFSWGGSVVAELLRRGLLPLKQVIMIAPVTAVIAGLGFQTDAALQVKLEDSRRVHVFHAVGDSFFCPHPERWLSSGVIFHMCTDSHVFSRRRSKLEIVETIIEMLGERED